MITTFKYDSKEHDALVTVARILNTFCTNGYRFYVDDIYYDYGQAWMWTTIIADNGGDSYQILCPRDHELIIENICWTRMSQAINNIMNEAKEYEHLAKFS